MKIARKIAVFVFLVILVGLVTPVTAQNDPVSEVYGDDLAADQRQIDVVNAQLMPIPDTQMYRYSDDNSGPPTLTDEEAGYITPTAMGAYQFQWNNPDQLPTFPNVADAASSGLGANINGGPLPGQTYIVFTAVMADDIPFGPDDDEFSKNFAFIISVHGHEGWVSRPQFPADTWEAAAYVLNITYGRNPWDARILEVRGGDLKETPASGFWYVGGNVVVFGVDAAMFGTSDDTGFMDNLDWLGFGWAGHVHDGSFGSCDTCLSKLTTYPSTPRSQGDTFPIPVYTEQVLKPGFDPLADISGVWPIAAPDGFLWLDMKLDEPLQDGKLPDVFSFFLGVNAFDGNTGGFFATQTHDGIEQSSGSGPDGEVDLEAYGMSDGSYLLNTGLEYDSLNYPLTLGLQSGIQLTEDAEALFSNTSRSLTRDQLIMGDPLSHDGTFPVYDFGTGEMVDPPASAVTTTTQPASTTESTQPASTTETTQPGSTTDTTQPLSTTTETTQPASTGGGTTTTREGDTTRERPGSQPVCWWCWAILLVFLVFLICSIYIWYKVETWWTCWLPWFLVIFIWVPFVLAGLIFWTPWWWWLPLLIWFPIVFGYAWWWAQKRTWWQPQYWWMLYGWGAVALIGLFLAGPQWWYLMIVYWLPFVGFWAWYRPHRFTWWAPRMWLLVIGWVAWGFIWVILLTPWWAWWFPVAFFPIWGWWLSRSSYTWREFSTKYCWILPFAWLPWLGYMLLLYCLDAVPLG